MGCLPGSPRASLAPPGAAVTPARTGASPFAVVVVWVPELAPGLNSSGMMLSDVGTGMG